MLSAVQGADAGGGGGNLFGWWPDALIALALKTSWNLGLEVGALSGRPGMLVLELARGGVVYVLLPPDAPRQASRTRLRRWRRR